MNLMNLWKNYIDDITGTMLAVIKKLYTQRLKEEGLAILKLTEQKNRNDVK